MALSEPFSKLLRSIGVNTSLKEVHSKIIEIKSLADDPIIKKTPASVAIQAAIQDLNAQINSLSVQLISVATMLETYESHLDLQLPSFINTAKAAINDFKSAYDATLNYDKVWFSKLLMSIEAKKSLAQAILMAVSVYTQNNTNTLSMIANGDPVLITEISTPIDDDSL
jgi:hypothetical protein